jgi:hypothetical protein
MKEGRKRKINLRHHASFLKDKERFHLNTANDVCGSSFKSMNRYNTRTVFYPKIRRFPKKF